jgi:hypothetical protein
MTTPRPFHGDWRDTPRLRAEHATLLARIDELTARNAKLEAVAGAATKLIMHPASVASTELRAALDALDD